MEYLYVIGPLTIRIFSNDELPDSTEAAGFRLTHCSAEQPIQVKLHKTAQFPYISSTPVAEYDAFRVTKTDTDSEIREYIDIFSRERRTIAQSVRTPEQLDVYFRQDYVTFTEPYFRIWDYLHLEQQLLERDALIFHCCYLQYQNEAILFSAPSGTGKTTQGKLWEQVYDAKIVNGDRALLCKKQDLWHSCGFPIHGSAPECENRDYPIRAIVIIRRADRDYVEKLSPLKAVSLIFSECTVNAWSQTAVEKTLQLLEDFICNVPVVLLHCTMRDSAPKALHQYLYGE